MKHVSNAITFTKSDSHSLTGRLARTGLALVLALIALIVSVPSAFAHDVLDSSDPADGSTVIGVPEQVVLSFNNAPQEAPNANTIEVLSPSGVNVAIGDMLIEQNTVTQALDQANSEAGTYTVNWAIVSSDGHANSGAFSFEVQVAVAPLETVTPTPEATVDEHLVTEMPTTPQIDEPVTAAPEQGVSPLVWVLGGLALAAVVVGLTYLTVRTIKNNRESQ